MRPETISRLAPDSKDIFLNQIHVLKGTANGLTKVEISLQEHIPFRMPKQTIEQIQTNMSVSSEEQMVAIAIASGLITIDTPANFSSTDNPPQKGLAYLTDLANGKTKSEIAGDPNPHPGSIERHINRAVRHYHASPANYKHAIAIAISTGDIQFSQNADGIYTFSVRERPVPVKPESDPKVLSRVEKKAIILRAQGRSFKEIADELGYAEGTLRAHNMPTVYKRLDLHSTTQATIYLVRENVIPLDEIIAPEQKAPPLIQTLTPHERETLDAYIAHNGKTTDAASYLKTNARALTAAIQRAMQKLDAENPIQAALNYMAAKQRGQLPEYQRPYVYLGVSKVVFDRKMHRNGST